MGDHDPYDDDVAAGGDDDDEDEGDDVDQLDVPREDERIARVVRGGVHRRDVGVRVSDVH